MVSSSRPAFSDLSVQEQQDWQTQLAHFEDYDFYQLVEVMYSLLGIEPSEVLILHPEQEPIRFKSHAGLGFPAKSVVAVTAEKSGKIAIETTILGLHGRQSPLPGYYLDAIAWETAHNEQRVADLLNLFNHRLHVLLYLIWRKYRYHICFCNEGKDHFSQKIFALVGLGHEPVRQNFPINHSKMLAYAGILATPGRSPEVICNLVSHCFDLSSVSLQPWQFRWVMIKPEQQVQLGIERAGKKQDEERKALLGKNFILGERMADRSGKFQLTLSQLSRQQFLSFLPEGDNYIALVTFIAFILRDQLAWSLRLELEKNVMGGMRLGDKLSSQLGWTTLLGVTETAPFIVLTVQV